MITKQMDYRNRHLVNQIKVRGKWLKVKGVEQRDYKNALLFFFHTTDGQTVPMAFVEEWNETTQKMPQVRSD